MQNIARPIVDPPRNCWAVARARQAGLLVDASDYYVAFYQAALEARRYILLSGWQFDSGVELLRGDDTGLAKRAGAPTTLLQFLNHLCETRPELEIDILAWDFHVVFALEREWMQKVLFHWKTHKRLRFHFDSTPPDGGCHHQKFVVVDGHTAFLGGIDLCEARWDDRSHSAENPRRLSRGKPQKPYHDVQAYLLGAEAVAPLTSLFCERWRCAGGDPRSLGAPSGTMTERYEPRGALTLPPGEVAFSQTDPEHEERGPVRHIAELFGDAIEAAERLIYLETQYFSSREIRDRLEQRMREASRGRLQVVIIVNARAEAAKEQIAVGLRQAENLTRLRQVAKETGHAFGCYYSVCAPKHETAREEAEPTYIHTKLLLVDDRVLSVGSANLTNRSMGLDTELQVTWDAGRHEAPQELIEAIRAVRVSLLAEHAGLSADVAPTLNGLDGLVDRLNVIAERSRSRLRFHPSPTPDEVKALALVDPQQLPFDPAGPDGSAADELTEDKELFRAGLGEIWSFLTGPRASAAGKDG
jgi:phospholipase D1/2